MSSLQGCGPTCALGMKDPPRPYVGDKDISTQRGWVARLVAPDGASPWSAVIVSTTRPCSMFGKVVAILGVEPSANLVVSWLAGDYNATTIAVHEGRGGKVR